MLSGTCIWTLLHQLGQVMGSVKGSNPVRNDGWGQNYVSNGGGLPRVLAHPAPKFLLCGQQLSIYSLIDGMLFSMLLGMLETT